MESFISSFNTHNHQPVQNAIDGINTNALVMVALGKVLRSALTEAQSTIESHRIISRCDELPTIEGNLTDFEDLFAGIVSFISEYEASVSRQFLYVHCKEEAEAEGALSKGIKRYSIQFYTNIVLDDYWQTVHQHKLRQCNAIANKYNGTFSINKINSGCLFTLLLAGKPL